MTKVRRYELGKLISVEEVEDKKILRNFDELRLIVEKYPDATFFRKQGHQIIEYSRKEIEYTCEYKLCPFHASDWSDEEVVK